jgi:hypothetical protein
MGDDPARDIIKAHGHGRDAFNIGNGLLKGSENLPGWQAAGGGFGLAAGTFRTAQGIAELADGQVLPGVRDTSGGLGWMAGGAGNVYKAFGENATGSTLGQWGGGLSALSGGIQMTQGIDRLMNGSGSIADNTKGGNDLLRGGVSTAAGIATAMGANVSPHAAAFATGCAVGDFGEAESARLGLLGTDATTGRNRSITDWASDVGADAGSWVMDQTGSNLATDVATMGTTALACLPGTAMALGSAAMGAGERFGSWVGSFFD